MIKFRWQYISKIEPISWEQETISLDKWYQPLSEPVRPPKNIRYMTYSDFINLELLERIDMDKWYQPLSEPVRPPKKAAPHLYSYLSWNTETLPAPPIPPALQPIFRFIPSKQTGTGFEKIRQISGMTVASYYILLENGNKIRLELLDGDLLLESEVESITESFKKSKQTSTSFVKIKAEV